MTGGFGATGWSLAVLIGRAGEDDLALVGLKLLWRRGRGGWGGLRGEGEIRHAAAEGVVSHPFRKMRNGWGTEPGQEKTS
jgi:hypothetical protein